MSRTRVVVLAASIVAFSLAASARAACSVTVQGRYDTPVVRGGKPCPLKVYFAGSEQRPAWWFWDDLQFRTSRESDTYEPGGWFSETLRLPGKCGRKRRFRMKVVALDPDTKVEVATAWAYVPSATDWVRSDVLDLGDLGKLFP